MNDVLGLDPEARKARRSRRWVRQYEAAMNGISAVWYSDLATREISWVGKDKDKKPKKRPYKPRQKVEKPHVHVRGC